MPDLFSNLFPSTHLPKLCPWAKLARHRANDLAIDRRRHHQFLGNPAPVELVNLLAALRPAGTHEHPAIQGRAVVPY